MNLRILIYLYYYTERTNQMQEPQVPTRRIIATSFSSDRHLLSDVYKFLEYTSKILVAMNKGPNIKICYLGTANDDSWIQQKFFIGCVRVICPMWSVSVLNITDLFEIDKTNIIKNMDIVFVASGNTAKLLNIFKTTKFDKILKEAYDTGVIMSGVSAGLLCWMTEGITDNYVVLTKISCLGFLPFSATPHANNETRKSMFDTQVTNGLMCNGYSVSDGSIIYFQNEEISDTFDIRGKIEFVTKN